MKAIETKFPGELNSSFIVKDHSLYSAYLERSLLELRIQIYDPDKNKLFNVNLLNLKPCGECQKYCMTPMIYTDGTNMFVLCETCDEMKTFRIKVDLVKRKAYYCVHKDFKKTRSSVPTEAGKLIIQDAQKLSVISLDKSLIKLSAFPSNTVFKWSVNFISAFIYGSKFFYISDTGNTAFTVDMEKMTVTGKNQITVPTKAAMSLNSGRTNKTLVFPHYAIIVQYNQFSEVKFFKLDLDKWKLDEVTDSINWKEQIDKVLHVGQDDEAVYVLGKTNKDTNHIWKLNFTKKG
uniref:EIF2A domain-containing protein n=1 Tax=Steinernema glaseri TaxID=37863 RepID=A0A1I7Z986_9BILA